MSRYTYNASLVSEAIETLNLAANDLNNTNSDIQKGINTIYNARGSENINVDFSVITGYQSSVIDYIDTMSSELASKATEIEEYQSAPWYKKLFATIGMGALKIVEGLGTFVENIGDGLVSVAGFVGGIFSSDFQASVAEFVKTDHVGDAFAAAYEGDGALGWINDYSVMSHTSTAANVLKGIGVAAGYVVVSVATGGLGAGASLGVSAGVSLIGGIGSGTQSGLQAGQTFNQAFGSGVKQGVVAAGTTLVVGGLANKLSGLKGASMLDDVGTAVTNSADEVMNSADDFINSLDDASRSLITEGGDDTIKILGQVTDKSGNTAILVQNSNGVKSLVGTNVNGGTTVLNMADKADEVLAGIKNAGGTIDDFANAATKFAGSADEMTTAISTVVNNADEAAGAVTQAAAATDDAVNASRNIIQKVADKVDDAITNFGTNTKVGQALVNVTSAAGPTVTNAVATAAGTVTSGNATTAVAETTAYRVAEAAAATPSAGESLYNEATTALENGTPTAATESEAAANYDKLVNDGYNPGGSNDGNTGGNTDGNTGGSTGGNGGSGNGNNGGNNYSNNEKIGGTDIDYSYDNTPSSGDTTPNPGNTKPDTGNTTPSSNDSGISTTLPGGNDPTGPSSPTITPDNSTGNNGTGSGSTGNSSNGTSTSTSNLASTDILDSLGGTTTSLSGLATSSTNIPTSSTPILSSDGTTKSASVIPVAAGLGAASLAGFGTKKYLDKKDEDEEEEEDSIETEEWQEDAESMNIDYGDSVSEDADYLMPTDEFAFQEN